MHCPKCYYLNPQGAENCLNCGANLPIANQSIIIDEQASINTEVQSVIIQKQPERKPDNAPRKQSARAVTQPPPAYKTGPSSGLYRQPNRPSIPPVPAADDDDSVSLPTPQYLPKWGEPTSVSRQPQDREGQSQPQSLSYQHFEESSPSRQQDEIVSYPHPYAADAKSSSNPAQDEWLQHSTVRQMITWDQLPGDELEPGDAHEWPVLRVGLSDSMTSQDDYEESIPTRQMMQPQEAYNQAQDQQPYPLIQLGDVEQTPDIFNDPEDAMTTLKITAEHRRAYPLNTLGSYDDLEDLLTTRREAPATKARRRVTISQDDLEDQLVTKSFIRPPQGAPLSQNFEVALKNLVSDLRTNVSSIQKKGITLPWGSKGFTGERLALIMIAVLAVVLLMLIVTSVHVYMKKNSEPGPPIPGEPVKTAQESLNPLLEQPPLNKLFQKRVFQQRDMIYYASTIFFIDAPGTIYPASRLNYIIGEDSVLVDVAIAVKGKALMTRFSCYLYDGHGEKRIPNTSVENYIDMPRHSFKVHKLWKNVSLVPEAETYHLHRGFIVSTESASNFIMEIKNFDIRPALWIRLDTKWLPE
ncbi:MAG: zinc ribbon domain-containing protein [Pseudomonadota bacterium]